ncbi:CSLREA domain-containing protein [Pseudomonas mangrovi]|uniref:CSLREA domain-containing protein n=1 Tax=Pseudomonas mangrovi TaxID=2161748 RepID=A0A2T5PDG8_9PSED|nr:CSLREA domain-containing protein [Pseudomonas mangrovi]PTU75747.1 hypothetical protein DBO85_03490 [Pseudomonas mangrovi]
MFQPVRSRLLLRLPMLLLCLGLGEASAATFTVNQTQDGRDGACDSHCTLRDAIDAANSTPGSHLILLPDGEYLLDLLSNGDEDGNASDDLDLTADARIVGSGYSRSVIRSVGLRHRLFEIHPGARLRLERLSLKDGFSPANGGAVENHGRLELRQVLLEGNRARTVQPVDQPITEEQGWWKGQGGAIANYGEAHISWSAFVRNSATGGEGPNPGRGGAIFNRGVLFMRDSRLESNGVSSPDDKGAGAGVYNRGVADIARSLFYRGGGTNDIWGTAIANDLGGQLKLVNSTLAYGRAEANAAFNNGDPYRQDNQSDTRAQLIHVSIIRNTSAGIDNRGRLQLRNSLVIGNYLDADETIPRDCNSQGPGALLSSSGLMLVPTGSNCPAELHADPDNLFGAVIAGLDDTQLLATFPLPAGSPAIDAGIGNCSSHDQQRAPRPQDGDDDGDARCDLGAYERGSRPTPPVIRN